MKVKILNTELFYDFLRSVSKIAPAAEFKIDTNGCTVYSVNESNTVRLAINTNVVKCDSETIFCLNDVTKLIRAINALNQFKKDDSHVEMNCTESFIGVDSAVKFKLKTVKREVIARYVTSPIKTVLVEAFGFTLTGDGIKKISQLSAISVDNAKAYITKVKDNTICIEADDKTLAYSDSIGIECDSAIRGDWTFPICLKFQDLGLINILNTDVVDVSASTIKVISSRSSKSIPDTDYKLDATVITTILKN